MVKVIAECLRKSKDETRIRLLRLLPNKILQCMLDEHIFICSDLKTVIPLIGLLL